MGNTRDQGNFSVFVMVNPHSGIVIRLRFNSHSSIAALGHGGHEVEKRGHEGLRPRLQTEGNYGVSFRC
jgi:hypothetical protein